MTVELTTPVCRLLAGHPSKPFVDKDGKTSYWFHIGINKAAFPQEIAAITQALQTVAMQAFPNYNGNFPGNFAWKMSDGDATPEKDGHAGHFILRLGSNYPTTVWDHLGSVMMPDSIKAGDFFLVKFSGTPNKPKQASHTPGLYLNPTGVMFKQEGPPIIMESGPSFQDCFGDVAAAAAAAPVPGVAPTAAAPAAVPGVAPTAAAPADAWAAMAAAPVTPPTGGTLSAAMVQQQAAATAPVTAAPVTPAAAPAAPGVAPYDGYMNQ